MRPPEFSAAAIATLLRQQKIATLPELMAALGTDARRTVFRKLKELSSRTSYSHRGRYYTLDDVAVFDELGLWAHEEVWFSSAGTLLSTGACVVGCWWCERIPLQERRLRHIRHTAGVRSAIWTVTCCTITS